MRQKIFNFDSIPNNSVTKYEITSENYRFVATINKQVSDIEVLVGLTDNCAMLELNVDKSLIYLGDVFYLPKCANRVLDPEKLLDKGSGTIEFLNATISFLFTIFKGIYGITFRDMSYIKSKIDNDIEVSLRDIYLACYGKTWYEEHFKALPADMEHTYDMLYKFNKHCENTICNDFTDFRTKYIDRFKLSSSSIQIISDTYNDTLGSNIRDFFVKLRGHDCSIYNGWLSYFVKKHTKTNLDYTTWVIIPEYTNNTPINYTQIFSDKTHQGGSANRTISLFTKNKTHYVWDNYIKDKLLQYNLSNSDTKLTP
jgi:hypothetical protein